MQNNQQNIQKHEENEIDLRELFKTIWGNKVKIILITFLMTSAAVVYTYMKTPIYEVKALVEIGNYKLNNNNNNNNDNKVLLDNNAQLVKKLNVLFIDMYKSRKNKLAEITSIDVVKQQDSFIEIKSEAISNELAVEEVEKVVIYIQNMHQNILDDVKVRREFEIKNIDSKISNINDKELSLLDEKIKLQEMSLKNYEKELLSINKNIKNTQNINPTLTALNIMEKANISNSIFTLNMQLIDTKNAKDNLKTTRVNDLIEQKNLLLSMLLPYNYKNSEIVGKIITSDYPIKPKKILIVTVAFVTGFILSIFLVFFMEFIKSFKKEEEGEVLN